jgi:hypothetical protein
MLKAKSIKYCITLTRGLSSNKVSKMPKILFLSSSVGEPTLVGARKCEAFTKHVSFQILKQGF